MALDKGDSAMLRDGQCDVFKDGTNKVATHDSLALGAATHDLQALISQALHENLCKSSQMRVMRCSKTS